MERYKNLGGDSGVVGYVVGIDSITVHFNTCDINVYSNKSAGTQNIENMKLLDRKGRGLNGFIMKNVKQNFASKSRK